MERERFAESPVGRLIEISGTDGRTLMSYRHVAFVPNPLGAEPPLAGETWRRVARAGYALGRLRQSARHVPAPGLLRRPTLRREAQSTSALEGTFAPLEDVLASDIADVPPHGELHEVLNYVRAAEVAFGALADGFRVAVPMLCELHAHLVGGTAADTAQAGRIRDIQVAIGSPSQDVAGARFVPPPPGPHLESGLRDLMVWINAGPSEDRDPVVSAALAHYQFEALHPFNDGNGRLGRLLVVLQLMQDGIITEPLLSVSPWFERRRARYQDALAEVSASGEWDGWVSFFAAGLEASALDTSRRVDRLLDIQAAYIGLVREARIGPLGRDVAELLVGYPYVTVADLARRTGRTFAAVNNAVKRLVEVGILVERTGRAQSRQFVAVEVVEALTGPV